MRFNTVHGGPFTDSATPAELPPMSFFDRLYAKTVFYPTLGWNFLLGRVLHVRHWWDRVDTHVIVGAYPFARDIPKLYDHGVRAVVNTCEEYEGPVQQYQDLGIQQLRIPTTDFTHPKLDDVRKAVEFTQEYAQENQTVYIHCKAGRARSATVAMCWLMKYRNMTMPEAQAKLLEHRSHVNPRLADRPVVQEFAKELSSD